MKVAVKEDLQIEKLVSTKEEIKSSVEAIKTSEIKQTQIEDQLKKPEKVSKPEKPKVKLPGKNKTQDNLIAELKQKQTKDSTLTLEQTVLPTVSVTTETTSTTTDILKSDSETLKQIATPESETVEDHHLRKLQAVEPLIELHKPRVLEEVIPYVIKPPPELVPGSAVDKLFSVEKSGVSDIVLTDFKVGIEVNVEVGDEMSRRYTSSARSG